MNRLLIASRVLMMITVVFSADMVAKNDYYPYTKHADVFAFAIGYKFITEERASALLGEKLISPRNQVIVGKALINGAGHFTERAGFIAKNIDSWDESPVSNDMFHVINIMEKNKNLQKEFVGYVIVNGALRLVGEKYSVEEKIEQKCDEILSSNVAGYVKPVAKIGVDLAYNYAALAIIKGIIDGYNKS